MDYTAAAILFAIGFGASVLARGVWEWTRSRREQDSFPLKDGAVPLDQLAGVSRVAGRAGAAEERGGTTPVEGKSAPPDREPSVGERRIVSKARKRR